MNRVLIAIASALLAVTVTSCIPVKPPAPQPSRPVLGASLWERPTDLPRRDLFYGPWGATAAPDPHATFRFAEGKHSGVNPGMKVIDPQGREWSVKQAAPGGLDNEGPVEVALSRILSAIGYHQPAVYFLPSFTLKDDWGIHTEPGGRFRLKDEKLKETGIWSWQENPFVGSSPYQGLLVLLVMFNSTDLKNSNNSVYEYRNGDRVERWYVVRDIGAALGDTFWLAPLKGNPSAFEQQPFIIGFNQRYVDFGFKGLYQNLVQNRITRADVQWASNLLAQLSDRQWGDAFRAGGYQPEVANRFIHKLREKMDEGRGGGRRVATE